MATQVTVSGTLKDAEGNNLSGTITFRPSSPFYDLDGNQIIGTAPIDVTLASGTFSVTLYATDDSTTVASDATYKVTEDLTGTDGNPMKRKFKVEVPSASPTLRYEDMVEVQAQAQYSYATLAYVQSLLDSFVFPEDSVTNARMANMAQATIKGRASGAGAGDPQDLTATQARAVMAVVRKTGDPTDGTGILYWGDNDDPDNGANPLIVKDNTIPSSVYPTQSTFDLQHNGDQGGYIFHLTGGASMGGASALMAMGIDYGGTGLLVRNKATGKGVSITQTSTVSATNAYGLLISCGEGKAPGFWLQQNANGGPNYPSGAVFYAYSYTAGQKLVEFRSPATPADASGVLSGYVRSDGVFIWQHQAYFSPIDTATVPLTVQGLTGQATNLQQWYTAGVGTVASIDADGTATVAALTTTGASTALLHRSTGAGSYVEVYDTNGTTDKRKFRLAVSSATLVVRGRLDDGSASSDLLQLVHDTQNTGIAGAQSYAGGTKVIAIPNAGTNPSGNPTGGGVLYVDGGALKWLGTSGSAQTIGPANGTGVALLGSANTFTSTLAVNTATTADAAANVTLAASATTAKPLVVQAKASQTANLTEWQKSDGTITTRVDPVGRLLLNTTSTTGFVHLGIDVAARVGLAITAAASQSADMQRWSDSSTNVLLSVAAGGHLTFANSVNVVLGTGNGTKIGTGTTQKLAFWNKTPIVQPTTAVTGATFVGGGGTAVTTTDTFGGYTLAQIAAALVNVGILA